MSMSTIDLIQEAFNSHNIKYRLVETEQISFIDAGYNIAELSVISFVSAPERCSARSAVSISLEKSISGQS